MIKVTLIGTGNVSFHLQEAFSKTTAVEVVDVLPGRSDFKDLFSRRNSPNENNTETDVFIIAVSDNAIKNVGENLWDCGKLVVHTSGSVPMSDLPEGMRKGVFYPVQTFSKERAVDFETVPICIESDNPNDLNLLKRLASTISGKVFEIDSEQRKALHLAAVFVNNFTNHLYHISVEICRENKISFELLKPLIFETASKIRTLNPKEAQTGPAKRNDTVTIKRHLAQLKSIKQREIYSILTQSIQSTYGEKL
jgi:predicted short-subunit dehydrogenase-like oxidoreductase (DUF2520 family)